MLYPQAPKNQTGYLVNVNPYLLYGEPVCRTAAIAHPVKKMRNTQERKKEKKKNSHAISKKERAKTTGRDQ